MGRRRASEAGARGADLARERALDRARTSTCSGSCTRRCSTTARCTRSINSSCAAGERSSSSARMPRSSPGPTRRASGSAAPRRPRRSPAVHAWGVKFDTTNVVTDNRYGLSIGGRFQPVRHIGFVGLDAGSHEPGRPDHLGLGLRQLRRRRALRARRGATAKLTPLISSSVESEAMPAERFQFLPDRRAPERFHAGRQRARARRAPLGPLKSAFPDGAPTAEDREAPVDAALAGAHSPRTTRNLVLVGDVDILSDRLWVQAQNFLGQRLVRRSPTTATSSSTRSTICPAAPR